MRKFFITVILLCPFFSAAQDNESAAKLDELESKLSHIQQMITANDTEVQKQIGSLADGLNRFDADKQRLKSLALESYRKAVQFTSEKQYQTAGIYYGNALALDPDNVTILNSYTNAVIEWVSSRQQQGDYESAQQTLSDYIRYLYTFSAGLPLDGADYLVSTFWTLTDYQTRLFQEAEGKKLQLSSMQKKELEKDIQNGLKTPLTDNESSLTEEFRKTQLMFIQWQRVAPDEAYLTDLLSKRLSLIADNVEAISLLKYGDENMRNSKQSGGIGPYYAASELYITNQRLVNLKTSLIPPIANRVDKFGKDLDTLSGAITSDSAKTSWERINNRKAEIMASADKTAVKEAAIKIWSGFAEEIALELPRAANPVYSAQMRSLLSEVNQRINVLREDQMRGYEKWSLQNISTMYDHYNNEVGMLSGGDTVKKRIMDGMKDYLCPVDTRYLSMAGMKLYNDIFDFFNKELAREQRISLAVQFNECTRKPLSDF